MTADEMLDALIEDRLSPEGFDHAAHVAVAEAALARFEFFEAAHVYASGLRRLVTRAGCPEKYNATLTLGFMAVIAEDRARGRRGADMARLRQAGYTKARLADPLGRTVPLLPLATAGE